MTRCLLVAVVLGLLGVGVAQADPLPPPHRYYAPAWFVPQHNKLGLSGGTYAQAQVLGASWLYDWTAQPPVREWFESVPMIGRDWGDGPVPAVGGNSPYLLGFNEPDLQIQANITPERAAVLWRRIEQAYPHKLLVAPAPSCGDVGWLARFRQAYRDIFGTWPRLDALAAHCYRWTAESCIQVARQFAAWVQEWHIPGGYWFTEFAFVPAWATDAEREARVFVQYIEADPLARRYAPFVAHTERGVWYWPDVRASADPSLFAGPGSLTLTEVGTWYQRQ